MTCRINARRPHYFLLSVGMPHKNGFDGGLSLKMLAATRKYLNHMTLSRYDLRFLLDENVVSAICNMQAFDLLKTSASILVLKASISACKTSF